MRQDKDYIEDILSSEKALSTFYTTATTECGTDEIRTCMEKVLTCALDMQKEVFQSMHSRGWYQLDEATTDKIDEIKTQFCKSPMQNS